MVSPATTAPPAGKNGAQAPIPVVPFPRAAKEHMEGFADETKALTAATQQLQQLDIPAYGYMRGILLHVTATDGTGSAAVAREDTPFNILQSISVQDVNGAPLFGPVDGFDLYLINKFGASGRNIVDAKSLPTYTAMGTDGNFAFSLWVPIEFNPREALGSLANQNASSTYKLLITLNSSTGAYSTVPTGLPNIRVRAYLDAWAQPTATDMRGQPQVTQPPAHGTTGYWSKYQAPIVNGANTIRLPRVGNYIRDLILLYRDDAATPVRNDSEWPVTSELFYDTRLLLSYTDSVWRLINATRFGFTGTLDAANGLVKGVRVFDFCHEFDGKPGNELRDGWLPTVQSTRLELQGSFTGAGSLTIITNDIAPAGEIFL